MPSNQPQEAIQRVNLRSERENRSLTIKDIHIRVGIPLEHIEALESGVVPKALRGRKLLRSKQAYLDFLGFPTHSKLDVRRKKERSKPGFYKREGTGSTDVVVPTASKSIFTGFGIAVAMVLSLKTLSVAMDNPAFSFEGMLDSMVESINDTSTDRPNEENIEVPSLTALANSSGAITKDISIQNNIDQAVQNLIETNQSPDFSDPILEGPNTITIAVEERSKLFFVCDGHLLHKGYVQRGDHFVCNFRGKAIVDLKDPMAAKITHNDIPIRPMGPQGSSRRLSFVHSEY
jgi:hypothetical protein